MTKPMSAFYPWVLPYVTGCPDPLAEQMIRSAAIAFCVQTDLIQSTLTANVVAGTQDYTITPATDNDLARILSVSWNGQILTPVSPDLVQQDIILRGVTVGTNVPVSGSPTWYFQKDSNVSSFSLYPIPDTAMTTGLTIKASFSPTNTAAVLADPLFDDWVEVISAGAIASLMAMPGQAFSSSSAPGYGKAFMTGITMAKRQKNSGKLPGSLRVLPVSFV